MAHCIFNIHFNPLNTQLNPICHLLALLGAHPILHVSRIRVNILPPLVIYSYISQIALSFWVSNKTLHAFLFSLIHAVCLTHLIFEHTSEI
jgi:hypothetical protein